MNTSSDHGPRASFNLRAFLNEAARIPAESERCFPPEPPDDAPRPVVPYFNLRRFLGLPERPAPQKATTGKIEKPTPRPHWFGSGGHPTGMLPAH